MTMLAAEFASKEHITAGADAIRDLLWLTASPECWDLFCHAAAGADGSGHPGRPRPGAPR